MTKKRILYSELSPRPTADGAAARAPEPAPAVAPVAAPVEAAPAKPRAPLDLARALAAARAAEATPAAPAPANVSAPASALAGRLTPMRSSVAIGRPTPARSSVAIGRPTPSRASIAITSRGDAALPAPAPIAGAPTLRERARARSGKVDLLIFAVGREWFGVELAAVEEAIDLPDVRHIPEMPPAMLGVITARGTLTSVYSPSAALGLPLATGSSALIFRRERGRLSIAVDDVDDVHTLDLAQLRDAPGADASDGVLLGVLRFRESLLALVDAEVLIAACQTVPVLETA